MKKQKYDSKGTSQNQVPATFSMKDFIENVGKTNFDYGGGRYDTGTDFLKDAGVRNYVSDVFNRPAWENTYVRNAMTRRPPQTMSMNNVLNVIQEPEVRKSIIKDSFNFIKPGGDAFYKIYEGSVSGQRADRSNPDNFSLFGTETKTQGGLSWQNRMMADAYKREISEALGVPIESVKRKGDTLIVKKPLDYENTKSILKPMRSVLEQEDFDKMLKNTYDLIKNNQQKNLYTDFSESPDKPSVIGKVGKHLGKLGSRIVPGLGQILTAMDIYDFIANPMEVQAPTIEKPKPKPEMFIEPDAIQKDKLYNSYLNSRNRMG